MLDTFHETASRILLADAELALTFIHVGSCRSEGEEKDMAFSLAAGAYDSICGSLSTVRMSQNDLAKLGALLFEIKAKLGEAARNH